MSLTKKKKTTNSTILEFVEIHLIDLGVRDVNIKGKIHFLLISYT